MRRSSDERPDVPLATVRAPLRGRGRIAPRAEATSDETQARGLGWGAIAAGVVSLAAAAAWLGPAGLRSPGPLARPHLIAGLECKSCHSSEPAARACVSCHGAHPSTRPAHRELAAAGKLPCTTCHAIHRDDAGVAFLASGEIIRYGTGSEWPVKSGDLLYRPEKTTHVPIVAARACSKCHDAKSWQDPVAACLLGGQADLGADRPTVCFDEHRTVTSIARGAPSRDAAWEAAREVAAIAPTGRSRSASAVAPVGIVSAGLVVAGLVVALERRRRKRARGGTPTPSAMVDLRPSLVLRRPVVNTSTCIGCHACVDACPYDVLEVERYVAIVARPDDCCGLTLCEQRCPNGSLVVNEGEPIEDRPRVSETLESADAPGVYLAGDLTGLPLIKNAISQGALALRSVAASFGERTGSAHDVIIIGAGPAGISAALEAKSLGLDYLVLEQGGVAESIRSFPRGKLVFDQPLGLPVVGELWLEESSKEELLGKWMRIVRRERLAIDEGRRVEGIAGKKGDFTIRSIDEDGGVREDRARRIVLAIGRRGSPRQLPVEIPEEALDRVHYSLADARSFADARVVVVGLGDVAMETAVAISRQAGATVTLVHRGSTFTRGKSRNVDAVKRQVASGRIEILLDASVTSVGVDEITIQTLAGPERRAYDALLIMIGSIPPRELLEAAGVLAQSPSLRAGGR